MPNTIHFAKVPVRNALLKLKNRLSHGNSHTDLLKRYRIDVVLDVGANVGQYARSLTKHGYNGRIVSFEPLPDAFQRLSANRWGFRNWSVQNYALGSENTNARLHIAGNSQSSSFQPMLDNHRLAAPESAYIGDVDVVVQRLDAVIDELVEPGDRCFMKVDVQGHEHHVLEGASRCLDRIVGIEAELSLIPLYEGQSLWQESIAHMSALGFELAMIQPGFCDVRTGVMLQADGVFICRSAIDELKAAAAA